LSELVASRPKPLISSYALIAIFSIVVGIVGVLLPVPKFAIVLLGIIVVTIALARTEFALALLVFAVPLTNEMAVIVCTAIVIASYVINNVRKKGARALTPFAWAFLAFLLFAAVSAVVAPSTVGAVEVIIRFIAYFALVYIVGRSIRSKEMLTWILVLMVISGAITGLYGLYQYIYAPDTAKIGLYDLTEDVAARIGSTFENPNFYAEYLVLIVPIGLALILGLRGAFRRIALGVATLFLFIGLILTYTRGSWMATGIGVVLMSLMTEAWLFWVWVSVFAIALVAAPGVASRMASITDVTGGTAGFRMKLWRIASGIIREHPVIGIGIGNYYDAFTEYIFRHPELSVGWVIYGAHNSYLTIWAETGIFGIMSFVAIILVSIKYGLYLARAKAQDKYLSWVNSAIFAGVIGFSINSLTSNSFHHPQGAVFFWFLLGLQVAIDGLNPEPTQSQTSSLVDGSLILRPFRYTVMYTRAAVLNHPIYRGMQAMGRFWQDSGIGTWLSKKPAISAFAEGSRAYGLISPFLEKIRLLVEDSALLRIVRGIGERPITSIVLFITIAVIVRILVELVTGR
ncbi:MAG TPA: O-antigen ligase family protein, partial [Anaerolineae bacterium]|nr:O-antigen ligase family protein [Anaerolineae bacterium]